MYGKSFVQASKDTWSLVKDCGISALINDSLISRTLMLTVFLASIAVGMGVVWAEAGGERTPGFDTRWPSGPALWGYCPRTPQGTAKANINNQNCRIPSSCTTEPTQMKVRLKQQYGALLPPQ